MFRFNIFLISIFFVLSAQAQSDMPEVKPSNDANILDLRTISLSYLSWTEFVDLSDGLIGDTTYANFYGLSLAYENEKFNKRFGTAIDAALLYGQANAGGTQTLITYQTSYRSWYGVQASYRWAYRLSPQITVSLGPAIIYREIKWPMEGAVTEVKSGAPINFGALVDTRIRMTRQWELRQTIGTLAFKASTIWSIGLGYKY